MGDAGSTLIGFTIIWLLISSTQVDPHPINAVTALWIIAIPLSGYGGNYVPPFT